MTNATLSCRCKKDYDYCPPRIGENVICKWHGSVYVVPGDEVVLECLDCDYKKFYDYAAKLTACTAASSHMIKRGHTLRHYRILDKRGTLCSHTAPKKLELANGDPPF
jgi:hypothetical protein